MKTYARLMEVMESELQEATGLPLTWFEVLLQLQDAREGRLRMQDLADSLLLSKSGITRLIDRMTAEGLIERTNCDEDRRVVYAVITNKGKSEYRRAAPVAFGGIQEHFSGLLSARELQSFRSTLEKLLENAASEPTRAAV